MTSKLLVLTAAAVASFALSSLPIVIAIGGALLLSGLFDWIVRADRSPTR
jgi:hypothetical protein